MSRLIPGSGSTFAAALRSKPIPHSLRIIGTVADWEEWTGVQFPDDGLYTFPAGLAPVEIDHGRDRGCYREPNVWIIHSVRP